MKITVRGLSYGSRIEGVHKAILEANDPFDDGTSLLILNYAGMKCQKTDAVEYTLFMLKDVDPHDKLLLVFEYESPDASIWKSCVSVARSYGFTDICIIDSGTDPLPDNFDSPYLKQPYSLSYFSSPIWFNWLDQTVTEGSVVLPNERNYKMLCLARQARRHRLKLASDLLDRGLEESILMSCGWHITNTDNLSVVNPMHRSKFPIVLPTESDEERQAVINSGRLPTPNIVKTAIFNIIPETGFEYTSIELRDGWGRGFCTEKTTRTYWMRQFPIWLTTPNFVQQQREMGFDVFDDIIDHRYDLEHSPYHRLEMVVAEIERLCNSYSLEEMRTLLNANWDRLEHNLSNLVKVGDQKRILFCDGLSDWLGMNVNYQFNKTSLIS